MDALAECNPIFYRIRAQQSHRDTSGVVHTHSRSDHVAGVALYARQAAIMFTGDRVYPVGSDAALNCGSAGDAQAVRMNMRELRRSL
jgi:hypothetical protein